MLAAPGLLSFWPCTQQGLINYTQPQRLVPGDHILGRLSSKERGAEVRMCGDVQVYSALSDSGPVPWPSRPRRPHLEDADSDYGAAGQGHRETNTPPTAAAGRLSN